MIYLKLSKTMLSLHLPYVMMFDKSPRGLASLHIIIIIIIIIIIKAICRAQDRPKATSALWQSAELSTVRMSTVLHITVKQKCMSSVVF